TVLLLGSSLHFRKKRKKDQQRFRELVNELKDPNGFIPEKPTETQTMVSDGNVSQDRLMSEETETTLLEQLKTFEEGEQYLQPNLTLPQLAVELQVNIKYLSYVINNHKRSDFNNYINRLRILYIVKKLRENPDYMDYKISYLSYECGFSSHSKFTAAFKNVTGLTPSSFINQVKIEQNGK